MKSGRLFFPNQRQENGTEQQRTGKNIPAHMEGTGGINDEADHHGGNNGSQLEDGVLHTHDGCGCALRRILGDLGVEDGIGQILKEAQ